MLGYEFFKVDPETGKVRELDEIFGPEAQRDFWLKLDDLAHDMCGLLKMLEAGERSRSADRDSRDAGLSRRDHGRPAGRARGHQARPRAARLHACCPIARSRSPRREVEAAVREDLGRCRLSIHLVGQHLQPRARRRHAVAASRSRTSSRSSAPRRGAFSRLVWIPPGLQVDDERQRKVLDALRMDPRIQEGADLLETPLEDLRTLIDAWLKKRRRSRARADGAAAAAGSSPQLYLIYDQRDADRDRAVGRLPVQRTSRSSTRSSTATRPRSASTTRRTCAPATASLIFYGAGNELLAAAQAARAAEERRLRPHQAEPGRRRSA